RDSCGPSAASRRARPSSDCRRPTRAGDAAPSPRRPPPHVRGTHAGRSSSSRRLRARILARGPRVRVEYAMPSASTSVLAGLLFLAATDAAPLTASDDEGNFTVPGTKGGIVYRRVEGQELALDAYVQRRGPRRPAVVVIHGGGYTSGSRGAFGGQVLETLTRAGYDWLSIDYRLGGPAKKADSLDDLRAALAFARAHADEWGLDAERIALLGEDTGAEMAALLAAEKPAGVRAPGLLGGTHDPANPGLTTKPGSGRPDVLVVHGGRDTETPPDTARRLCGALVASGQRCDLQVVEGAIHRAENWLPSQWTYKERVVAWLRERIGPERPDHEPYSTRLQKDLVFDADHGLKLDAWTPPGRGPFPAVVLAHGGGWEAGDKVTYIPPLFAPLARAGFAWFSIDYRLTPTVRHAEQMDDLRRALAFVRREARRFDVDPDRLAVAGESA